MRCPECGKEMRSYTGDHLYTESGLSYVNLHNISQWDCECGEHIVEISNIRSLHQNLAKMIINQESKLTGQELRFLRKELKLSGVDLARMMGVTNATLSRWEKGALKISSQADRLARLIYAGQMGLAAKKVIQQFPAITKDREPGKLLELSAEENAIH